jgi:hypothetical protein
MTGYRRRNISGTLVPDLDTDGVLGPSSMVLRQIPFRVSAPLNTGPGDFEAVAS